MVVYLALGEVAGVEDHGCRTVCSLGGRGGGQRVGVRGVERWGLGVRGVERVW